MKTLHRYLLRQILATLLMTVAVFTFVLLLGNALRDILPLLMSQKASLWIVAEAFGLLIPFVGVYALPMGMLTATLLVFGRFSADQEYTAARASGISLISLSVPIIILSLLLCGLSAWVNLDLGPRSRVEFHRIKFRLMANLASIQLPAGRPVTFKSGEEKPESYTISVGRNRNQQLEDVHLFQVLNETNLQMMVNAPRGRLEFDSTNRVAILRLFQAQVIYVANEIPMSGDITIRLDLQSFKERKIGISDLTYYQLIDEMKAVEQRLSRPLELAHADAADKVAKKQVLRKQLEDVTQPYRMQIHKRVAFSFACFGFTLIGIPLGIRVHRRETNIGIAIALLLVMVYYGLLIVAESLTNRPEFAPHLLMWLPNFVFQAVGAVLIWRANRGV